MKRILIFSLAYYPHVGGAEVAVKEITERISDIEFHLLTLRFGNEPREERIGNVFVHRVSGGSSYFAKILFVPRAAHTAYELHRSRRIDGAWAVMSYMLFPLVLLRFVGIRLPYILSLQEGDPFSYMFGRWFILPFRPLLRHGFSHAGAVTAISVHLARWAKHMGFHGEVELIPNGVHTALFSPVATSRPSGKIILGTTSRLVRKNALDTVIRALPLLPEYIRFVIYGTGPEENFLRALAKELSVEDRIDFLGFVEHSSVPGVLQECDIFIRPSRSEGMGNSFLEAMAAGLPVIATQEGGIADFLFDAKRNPDKETTGWAVDKDSPEQIAEAVKDILNSPEQVSRVVATARAMVLEKYDWNLIAERMRRQFDRLFGTR